MRENSDNSVQSAARQGGAVEWAFFALGLLLMVGYVLTLSANKLMWNDEFLSFYTGGVASFRDVVRVQLHSPISLDPPMYHLLSHAVMDLMGRSAMALRMPAMIGFWAMELALFVVVRRWGGMRAGVVAMLLPLMTETARYAAEGRPYGLLLGMYACSFACWYAATQRSETRAWALVGVTCSLAMAITSHYFGVLILVPVTVAELVRTMERKRFDWTMVAAMVCGLLSVVLILPFQRGVTPYRKHYYVGALGVRQVSQGYREMFFGYGDWPMAWQRISVVGLILAVGALLAGVVVALRRERKDEGCAVWAFAGTLMLMPVYGFVFAKVVTHTMEPKYMMPGVIGFAAIFAIVMQKKLQNTAMFAAVCVCLIAVTGIVSFETVLSAKEEGRKNLATLTPGPVVQQALEKQPGMPIYVQAMGQYLFDSYYTPDESVRKRFVFLYDDAREIQWREHNTFSVSAENIGRFTNLRTESYDNFLQQPQAFVVDTHSGWDWLREEFQTTGIPVRSVGRGFYGELLEVEPSQVK